MWFFLPFFCRFGFLSYLFSPSMIACVSECEEKGAIAIASKNKVLLAGDHKKGSQLRNKIQSDE